MTKYHAMKEDAEKAVASLREVLGVAETNAIVRDSAIKRFEYSFDIIWKLLKAYLEQEHNVSAHSPKTCFREAYRLGLVDYDNFWLALCDYRNLTVHTYKEKLAEEVYAILPKALAHFESLLGKIRK